METNELIYDDNNNNKTLMYLNERLKYSGLYVAINEDTKEGYVGMTESDLKKRIKGQINNSHNPEVNKLFNTPSTRIHIITFEPIDYQYADLCLYKGITYDEYIENYRYSRAFSNQLKKIEYEFYRFVQSKGFKMLNKERGFHPDAKNDYEHGYSEELIDIYENSLKKDNLFDPQIKKFLFPCKKDADFMNLKMQHLELQIAFNKMEKRVSELKKMAMLAFFVINMI